MNWIKMRTNLHDCPEVNQISQETGLDVFAVIGRLHRLWGWFDEWTEDGKVSQISVTHVTLDAYVCHTGFAQAVTTAGWLCVEDGVMILPNFDRHNGESARKRARAAERQRASRSNRTGKPPKKKIPGQPKQTVTKSCDQKREEKSTHAGACVTHTHAREEAINVEPQVQLSLDELRVDPWGEFQRLTGCTRNNAVMFAGTLNSGAERFTPDSLAESFIEELARREMCVWHPQNKGRPVAALSWQSEMKGYVNRAVAKPGIHGLVAKGGKKAPKDPGYQRPPCEWWREIAEALYGDRDIHTRDWAAIPHAGREQITQEFQHPTEETAHVARAHA